MTAVTMSKYTDPGSEETKVIVKRFLTECGPVVGCILVEQECDGWFYKNEEGDRVVTSFKTAVSGFVQFVKDVAAGFFDALGVTLEKLSDVAYLLGGQLAPIVFAYLLKGGDSPWNTLTKPPLKALPA